MKRVTKRPLPSGRVPFESIADPTVRSAVMRINDNIASLKGQIGELQKAVNELQRRK